MDHECYEAAVRKSYHHQADWLREGYAPLGFYLKDFTLIRSGDRYHLFHIQGVPGVSCCLPGNEIYFGHASTADFLTWTAHDPVLPIRERSWEDGHVFAPYVLPHEGKYYMFYTGVRTFNSQRIGLAVSDDLFHWTRHPDNPLIRPEEYPWSYCPTDRGAACRDPHVMRCGDQFLMYYTAFSKDGRGCVAVAASTDLVQWEDRGLAYTFAGVNHCESSNVQEMQGKYYLFFGGHHEWWSYVVSDNPSRWPATAPQPLIHQATAMEVVDRSDPEWLVAYFKNRQYRMFLGTVDFSSGVPVHREITTPAELAGYWERKANRK